MAKEKVKPEALAKANEIIKKIGELKPEAPEFHAKFDKLMAQLPKEYSYNPGAN